MGNGRNEAAFREYDLRDARRHPVKEPAGHQVLALEKLGEWYESAATAEAGGILALPTGAGKTFTAVQFLCRRVISDGYKVVWLAQNHHLLDQAFRGFEDGVGLVAEPRRSLAVRLVSGADNHCRVDDVRETDDVVIGSLLTVVRAVRNGHEGFDAFLRSAGEKLFVVFDEAHHAPAPSYRKLIQTLRKRFPRMYLLGLTATPTYTDESKRGWLTTLFPQGIIHQDSVSRLMAAGVLALPILEEARTSITAEFDRREYEGWVVSHRDLPEDVISDLALNKDRNRFIAEHYTKNREKYGKTIIFTDRWRQCEQIAELLKARGIRAATVYSQADADGAVTGTRAERRPHENAVALRMFRAGEIDVLVNVRMLTEGTDVPDVQTVFLTRATTSRILLTQMVGRALRGPKFGGTEVAYVVSFVDNWQYLINWETYDEFGGGTADDGPGGVGTRPPVGAISISLVRDLARRMDSGGTTTPGQFRALLPVGWYQVDYLVRDEGGDDLEPVRELIMVLEDEVKAYRGFLGHLAKGVDDRFAAEDLTRSEVEDQLRRWAARFFPGARDRLGTDLVENLFRLARHTAQNGAMPRFFPFQQRDDHDLDALAGGMIMRSMSDVEKDDSLTGEYGRRDRFWSVFYPRYDQFKSAYDVCVNRLLRERRRGGSPQARDRMPGCGLA